MQEYSIIGHPASWLDGPEKAAGGGGSCRGYGSAGDAAREGLEEQHTSRHQAGKRSRHATGLMDAFKKELTQ